VGTGAECVGLLLPTLRSFAPAFSIKLMTLIFSMRPEKDRCRQTRVDRLIRGLVCCPVVRELAEDASDAWPGFAPMGHCMKYFVLQSRFGESQLHWLAGQSSSIGCRRLVGFRAAQLRPGYAFCDAEIRASDW
jgi:hypothetical protein